MNLPDNVSSKMEYIQKVFLSVQDFMQKNPGLDELISFLDAEPPEFRSVVYESASFEIGLRELSSGRGLDSWKEFYLRSAKEHTFHMDIGLGWAFAKTEISPVPFMELFNPIMRRMVFDGVGYYYGLFKGRRTVKSQLIPEGIEAPVLYGFDQGLGRRLWYIAKGEVNKVSQLIQNFSPTRHPALWCGVGIACGYVGGTKQSNLELLLSNSGICNKQFKTGILMAAISRTASDSITKDIEIACRFVCKKTLKDIKNLEIQMISKLYYIYTDKGKEQFFNQLESEFL